MGFIREDNKTNGNNNNSEIKTVSSKVLATVPASDITLDDEITVNSININKDRRYYIEFLSTKKLCSLLISEELGNAIICSIGDYIIQAVNNSTNISLYIGKINTNDDTDTFTDLIIYEEEVKYLDSKYLETDLTLQNSISLGRRGNIGTHSSAVGYKVEASGFCSHAEGSTTTASGDSSHAEGDSTKASGYVSHAEGDSTKAEGDSSHAEGYETTASGDISHAEGEYTTASGYGSHSEGNSTIASSQYQHVQGQYNIEDKTNKYAHIVGNGKNTNNRANAHTLDWEGNAWYSGQVEGTNLPYSVSSKVLTTVTASNVKIGNEIAINNTSINKDRRYYIEFLGSKKLCSLVISEDMGNCITCNIGNYFIQAYNDSANIKISIGKINTDDTTTATFTDLVIHEEEVKYLDSKYLETDLVLQNSISLGRVGKIGVGSSAIGSEITASGSYSHAEGISTTASGGYSHAEGYNATAIGMSSHAEGGSTTATGSFSHAEGSGATASGMSSHAEGSNTIASSMSQHVQGKYNIEDKNKKYAHIVGNGEYNKRSNAHTLDWQGNGWFAGQVEGINLPYTVSSKVLGTVPASNVNLDEPITVSNVSVNKDRRYYIEFLGSKKLCSLLVSEGQGNCITCNIGNYFIQAYNDSTNISLYIGKINTDDTTTDTFTDLIIYEEEVKCLDSKYLETDLVLQNSISMGRVGDIGVGSSAIGNNTKASGNYSHAEGDSTKAIGNYSHAEGNLTTASGMGSHAEGNDTIASGGCSHAEGNLTTASGGFGSHAEGESTIASGDCSHTEGKSTIASGKYQHVQGKYNIEDKANKYAHIVGNGKRDESTNWKEVRSNAHTLDWEGNAWYAGQVYVGGNSQDDGKKLLSTADIYFDENGKLCITINGVTKKFTPDSE